MSDTSVNTLIEILEENNDFSQGEKLLLFISMSDTAALVDYLSKSALMAEAGMKRLTEMDSFVYGILRLGGCIPETTNPSEEGSDEGGSP